MKLWEASQMSALGGDATKQDTGRKAGVRVGGNLRVSYPELSGTLPKAYCREEEECATDGTLDETHHQGAGDTEGESWHRDQELADILAA